MLLRAIYFAVRVAQGICRQPIGFARRVDAATPKIFENSLLFSLFVPPAKARRNVRPRPRFIPPRLRGGWTRAARPGGDHMYDWARELAPPRPSPKTGREKRKRGSHQRQVLRGHAREHL